MSNPDDPATIVFLRVSCFDNPAKNRFPTTNVQELIARGAITTGTPLTIVG